MKHSMTAKVSVGVLAAIIALLFSMALSFQTREKQTESRLHVLHTYQVLNLLERIQSVMKDAETGQRGFLLTGDTSFLEPHSRASGAIEKLINDVKVLTKDNLEQQNRLARLASMTSEILMRQRQTIELRRIRGVDIKVDANGFRVSKQKMEKIRDLIENMIENETALLKTRNEMLDKSTTYSFYTAILFSVISIACMGASGWLLLSFLKARQRAERELSTQYSVARLFNESNELKSVAGEIERLIGQTDNWCLGATWVVDGDILKCLDVWHLESVADSEFVKEAATRTFSSGQGLPGQVWASKQAASIPDVTLDSSSVRGRQADASGLKAAFAFPVTFGGEVLAVMEFFSSESRTVDQARLDMMTGIGNQFGQFMVRKTVEEETEKQRQFLQLILDTVSDGIVVANTEGHFILSNEAARELVLAGAETSNLREDVSELYGIFTSENGKLFPSEELPLVRTIRGEEVDDVELFIRNATVPNGKWLSVSGRPLKEDGEKLSGGVIFFRDVSDKKEAEKRVSEFYSTVSHELRTPLTSIRGSLGLIEGGLAGEIPEKSLTLVKIARQESDRLIRLINDILDLRKIEAGMLELRKAEVETKTLVDKTVESMRGMAQERGIQLITEIETEGPTVCDEDRVTQILTNLISNAIKFSEKGDKVVVRLSTGNDNTFRFSVIDHGPGIADGDRHKLFEKFQQIDQSDTRKKEGTGLGLAITQAIVEEHGGKIGVESELGKGSTFWVELPSIFSPVQKPTTDALPLPHVHPALIVEDDDGLATVLQVHLEREGFIVVRANSLGKARQLLQMYKPLVILLDLGLPDGDGLDLFDDLSRTEKLRDTPVVVITGTEKKGDTTVLRPALVDWLAKPFDEARLHKALKVAKQRIGIAQVLLVEDDPATREIIKQQVQSLGVRCLEATNGVEALSRFDESNPDLIILDLMIPPPDGFAVVEKLQATMRGQVPLIVYSALDLTEAEKSKLKLGITAHLTKATATPDQLSNVLRDFLDGLLLRKPADDE